MKPLTIKAIISAVLFVSLNVQADEPAISITSRTQNTAPLIVLLSAYDFEKSISIKLRTDPKLRPSDVLIKMVSKIGMVDTHGVLITSGFDIDLANNLVLGFSGGTSEIIRSSGNPNALNIIASFKDKGGNFVSPPADALALYGLNGKKLCFEYKGAVKAAPKIAFTLILDRSGSMGSVINDVRISALNFIKALPPSAVCAVMSFNEGFNYHSSHYQNCNSGNFKLNYLNAQGGTNLYEPLLSAYENLSQQFFKDYQKAVIIITDGQIASDPALRRKINTAKKDILSFVYFLGQKQDQHLIGLADAFLQSSSDIKTGLSQYFKSLSSAYNAQKVLSVKQCARSNNNAKPPCVRLVVAYNFLLKEDKK